MTMREYPTPTRRFVLQASALAGGGFLLGLRLSGRAAADSADAFVPNAFVRIDPTGKIVLIAPHTEVGQGIDTAQAMLVGEELDVGLD